MEIAAIVISTVTALFVLYIEIIEARRNRKQDRKNQLVDILNDKIDQYCNMTTSILVEQTINLYRELSTLLFKNYLNVVRIIKTGESELIPLAKKDLIDLRILIISNTFLLDNELNKQLPLFEDKVDLLIDYATEKKYTAQNFNSDKEITQLFTMYQEIKGNFEKFIIEKQLEVMNVLKAFAKEYSEIDKEKK